MVEAEVDHVDDDQQHEQGECCEDGDDQDQLQGEQPEHENIMRINLNFCWVPGETSFVTICSLKVFSKILLTNFVSTFQFNILTS